MRAAVPSLLLSASLLAPTPTQSRPVPMPQGEIIIYRDRGFSGPAVSIRQDEPNLGLRWTVSSARVRGGTWQLCERTNFRAPCMTLSSSSNNLSNKPVQSARQVHAGTWHVLGDAEVSRFGWDHRTINVRGNPTLSALRFCAERNRIRLHDARVRFSNGRFQTLRLPLSVNSGSCTGSLSLTNSRWGLRSVDVTVSTVALAARGRIRLEGR